ncbi:MAG: DUF1127 domain-containing protein [Reyranella sp.]|nr:DUF1127 domain-containing protein [Reyranella sp.]
MQRTLRLITPPAAPHAAGLLPSLLVPSLLVPLALATLAMWRRRSRTRRQLATLDARELADLGLCRAQQHAEAGKWFWQP